MGVGKFWKNGSRLQATNGSNEEGPGDSRRRWAVRLADIVIGIELQSRAPRDQIHLAAHEPCQDLKCDVWLLPFV